MLKRIKEAPKSLKGRGNKKLTKVSKGEGTKESWSQKDERDEGLKRTYMYTSNVWFGMSDSEGLIWDIQKYEETKGKCEEGKCGNEDRIWLVLSSPNCVDEDQDG